MGADSDRQSRVERLVEEQLIARLFTVLAATHVLLAFVCHAIWASAF